mgnify:CR=1 FL=1
MSEELQVRRVEVRDLDGGPVRYGLLAEGPEGRMLLGLAAASAEELDRQLEDAGGAAAWLRRFGAAPLDPRGIAPQGDRVVWVPPAEKPA